MVEFTPEQRQKLMQIFHPYALERQSTARLNGTRFVHYTSADVAMNILRKREVWMRKSSCMNDFMEVRHGLSCLLSAYNTSEIGQKFKFTLDSIAPGISSDIERHFNSLVFYQFKPLMGAATLWFLSLP